MIILTDCESKYAKIYLRLKINTVIKKKRDFFGWNSNLIAVILIMLFKRMLSVVRVEIKSAPRPGPLPSYAKWLTGKKSCFCSPSLGTQAPNDPIKQLIGPNSPRDPIDFTLRLPFAKTLLLLYFLGKPPRVPYILIAALHLHSFS